MPRGTGADMDIHSDRGSLGLSLSPEKGDRKLRFGASPQAHMPVHPPHFSFHIPNATSFHVVIGVKRHAVEFLHPGLGARKILGRSSTFTCVKLLEQITAKPAGEVGVGTSRQ